MDIGPKNGIFGYNDTKWSLWVQNAARGQKSAKITPFREKMHWQNGYFQGSNGQISEPMFPTKTERLGVIR